MHLVVAALVAVAFALQPAVARAADLSGVWVIDQSAWRQQLEGVIAAMLRRMPPELVAQVKAQGVDPAVAFREAAAEGLDGTIEFLPGGIVRSVTGSEGASEDGRWALDGDLLRVEVEDADGLEALVGSVEADRITLRPILAQDEPANAFVRDIAYPLVRQGR
jgi:hypothetical protein